MPCIIISSNIKLENEQSQLFIQEASQVLADTMGKPEQYCMVGYQHSNMVFGGSDKPCAFIQLSSIGNINPSNNSKVAKALSAVVSKHLQVDGNRVYINFTDVKATNWGFNGGTF
uniref:L-dopachrome isomerase n=1 Tax=Trepomonas sp. PC1 TaxID=1076344 RepID=A0A146K9T3_9EUKA|eukprot:JAP93570.1 Putative macrophage migration inhibitory factor [Trepomonas sp. PC1]